MKTRHNLTALALVVTSTLVGCGQDSITGLNQNDDATNFETASATAQSGQSLFQGIEAQAMATLSLSEVVLITPFINGSLTAETATLSQLVAATPAIMKFQEAFQAEMAKLSVGDAVRVSNYMERTGKNRYPWPELDGDGSGSSQSQTAAAGETLFEGVESAALAGLTLSEAVLITPYLTGEKTPENSTLSEMVKVTPAITKFQAAFEAEMAKLSVGEVVAVIEYMSIAGKIAYPYPVLEGNPVA
jgi:hypothetical protein